MLGMLNEVFPTLLTGFYEVCWILSFEDLKEPVLFKENQIDTIRETHPLNKLFEEKTWPTPCLLASKQTNKCSSPHTPVKEQRSNGYSTTDESFDGSPLKLQQFRTESFITTSSVKSDTGEKVLLRPVHVHDARLLLSQYNFCVESLLVNCVNNNMNEDADIKDSPALPMWVICDGKDQEHTVMVGSRVSKHNDGTQYVLTNVTVQGQVFQDSLVIHQLWARRPLFCHNGKDLTTKCFAKYFLCGSKAQDEMLESEQHRALEIHFHWNRLTTLFEVPPADAQTHVKATVSVGDPRSAAHLVYTELCILQNFVEGITGGSVEWSSHIDDKPFLVRVKNLLKDFEAGMTYIEPKDNNADDTLFIKTAQNMLIPQREEFDFTEELWLVLKDCTSLQYLVDSIQYVIAALQTGDLQPVVHRDNKSRLGELIRDSYYSKMTVPSLESTIPLEMLVEMGIEKMCNDYTHVFLELVTMDSLDKFVRRKGTIQERLDGLTKLHHTLELIVMMDRLELPNIVLRIAARNALKYYETNAVHKRHTFTIPIQNLSAQADIDRLQLSMWQADISTTKGDVEVRAMYMFTEDPPFDYVQVPFQDNTMMQDDVKPYYFTCLTEDVVHL